MSNNGPMIELDGCDDVHLEGNRTESERFLKAKDSTAITAIDNVAGEKIPSEPESEKLPFYKRYLPQLAIAVISGVLVTVIVAILGIGP